MADLAFPSCQESDSVTLDYNKIITNHHSSPSPTLHSPITSNPTPPPPSPPNQLHQTREGYRSFGAIRLARELRRESTGFFSHLLTLEIGERETRVLYIFIYIHTPTENLTK